MELFIIRLTKLAFKVFALVFYISTLFISIKMVVIDKDIVMMAGGIVVSTIMFYLLIRGIDRLFLIWLPADINLSKISGEKVNKLFVFENKMNIILKAVINWIIIALFSLFAIAIIIIIVSQIQSSK